MWFFASLASHSVIVRKTVAACGGFLVPDSRFEMQSTCVVRLHFIFPTELRTEPMLRATISPWHNIIHNQSITDNVRFVCHSSGLPVCQSASAQCTECRSMLCFEVEVKVKVESRNGAAPFLCSSFPELTWHGTNSLTDQCRVPIASHGPPRPASAPFRPSSFW